MKTNPPSPPDAPDSEAQAAFEEAYAGDVPAMFVDGTAHDHLVEQADQLLANDDGPGRIFQQERRLVYIAHRRGATVRDIAGGVEHPTVETADGPYVDGRLRQLAQWLRSLRAGGERVSSPPRSVVDMLLRKERWGVPPLAGIATCPTLRPGAWSVLSAPGYDPVSGLYLVLDRDYPQVPERPSADDVVAARSTLDELLLGFDFESPADYSVALAAILTGLVRRSLPSAPLIGITAPTPGSGKTLLADLVARIVTGRSAAPITAPKDANEEAKVLGALLLANLQVALIDNVETALRSDFLCALLTSETMNVRVLGQSSMVSAPSGVLLLCTGNNLRLEGDLTSRALVCMLDPKTDRPDLRTFDQDVRALALSNRPQLVWAGLVLLRAYLASGTKPQCSWARFDEWAQLVPSAIVWADLPDPLESMKRLERSDPTILELERVLVTWHAVKGSDQVTLKDLVDDAASAANGFDGLREALLAVGEETRQPGSISTRRLGKWCERMRGRPVAGYRIERASMYSGTVRWRVVATPT